MNDTHGILIIALMAVLGLSFQSAGSSSSTNPAGVAYKPSNKAPAPAPAPASVSTSSNYTPSTKTPVQITTVALPVGTPVITPQGTTGVVSAAPVNPSGDISDYVQGPGYGVSLQPQPIYYDPTTGLPQLI